MIKNILQKLYLVIFYGTKGKECSESSEIDG